MKKIYLLLLILLSVSCDILAQIQMISDGTYTQDFNSLPPSGSITWVDNSTLPFWYAGRTGAGTSLAASDGSMSTTDLYSFGPASDTDRALGSVGTSGLNVINYSWGILLQNKSGAAITSIKIGYTGEQWRNSAAAAQEVKFYWRRSATIYTDIDPGNTDPSWRYVNVLSFTSPTTGGTAGNLDGNVNKFTFPETSIPSFSVPPNEYVMFRWSDDDHNGDDHGLSIDNLSITWTTHGPDASFFWNGEFPTVKPAAGGTGVWNDNDTWRQPNPNGKADTWSNYDDLTAILDYNAGTVSLSDDVSAALINIRISNYTLTPNNNTPRDITGTMQLGISGVLNMNDITATDNRTLGVGSNIYLGSGRFINLNVNQTAGNYSRLDIVSSGAKLETPINVIAGSNAGTKGNVGIVGANTGTILESTATFTNNTAYKTIIGATIGNDITVKGVITGSADLMFAVGTNGGGGTVLLNGANTYTGATYFNASSTGVIKLANTNRLPTATNVTMGYSSGFGGIFDLNGYDQTIASLTSNTGGLGSITNNGGSDKTLTINGSATPSAFGLPITDGSTNKVLLVRAGTGSTEITGANTYTGLTTVNSGLLKLNRSGGTTIPSTNSIVVNGGTLQVSTDQTLTNLTIESGATVTVNANLVITGTLTCDVNAIINGSGIISYQTGIRTLVYDGTGTRTAGKEWPVTNGPVNLTVSLGAATSSVLLPGNRTISGNTILTLGALNINGYTYTANGPVTGAGTFTGSSTSNLVLGSTAPTLNFTQTSAATRSLSDFTMTSGANATLATALDIYGTVGLTSASLNLSAQNLTLKSNMAGTARIADLTGSTLTGATNVTVERWIPMTNPGNNTGRRYQLLTPVVSTTTSIRTNWMEGGLVTTVGGLSNPNPGYGTHITGPGGNTNNFDLTQTNQASLYSTTNAVTPGYVVIGNASALLNPYKGYFLFVRGDRSTDITLFNTNTSSGGWINLPSSNTTLRATGTIQQGNKTNGDFANAVIGGAGVKNLITNPYPSPIDWSLVLSSSSGINGSYTYWDPHYGTTGGFISVNSSGTQTPAPPTPSLNARYIQSGQAFFVTASGAATPSINMSEAHKSAVNNNTVFLVPPENFSATLYYYEGGTNNRRAADGVRTIYDNNYSKGIDAEDVYEMANWDENMYIPRNGNNWVVESRPVIAKNDTMPLRIERLKVANYELEFTGESFSVPSLKATLIDRFTNRETLLNVTGTTVVPIAVTSNPASSAVDRFMVVFGGAAGPLPIVVNYFTGIKQNGNHKLNWKVSCNNSPTATMTLERSSDGLKFSPINTVTADAVRCNDPFDYVDASPLKGTNYYRLKNADADGHITYSKTVVLINAEKGFDVKNITPNPVRDGRFNLEISSATALTADMIITDMEGKQLQKRVLNVTSGFNIIPVDVRSLAAGSYQLLIINADSEQKLLRFVVQ